MREDLEIDGSLYISARRAAEICSYTRDYIGQLARSGKVSGKRIGNLWYVRLEDLNSYRKEIETLPKKSHTEARTKNSEEEIDINGRTFIPAPKAAKKLGYHHDYVSQLARTGKIVSQNISNRWYVDIEALKFHKREKDALLAALQAESVGLKRGNSTNVSAISLNKSEADNYYTYRNDLAHLMPQVLENRPTQNTSEPEVRTINIRKVNYRNSFQQDATRDQIEKQKRISGMTNKIGLNLLLVLITILLSILASLVLNIKSNAQNSETAVKTVSILRRTTATGEVRVFSDLSLKYFSKSLEYVRTK